MANRARRLGLASDGLSPGQLVRSYAQRNNWKIRLRNVMVEGELDVGYCEHASQLYEVRFGKRLLDADFAVFACGKHDEGGVWNLEDRFRTLANIIKADPRDERG